MKKVRKVIGVVTVLCMLVYSSGVTTGFAGSHTHSSSCYNGTRHSHVDAGYPGSCYTYGQTGFSSCSVCGGDGIKEAAEFLNKQS